MSTQMKPQERHIIWSDVNLDIDDWKDDLLAEDPDLTESQLYERMNEINGDYLNDERTNLDIKMGQPIVIIGDLGLWYGRRQGYKLVESGNIKDCLYSDTDYTEWYVDKYGDLRADAIHHDGTNHYLYRAFKEGVSETQKDNLLDKLYHGRATRADITRVTKRLGDEIGKVYGWDFPKRGAPERSDAR